MVRKGKLPQHKRRLKSHLSSRPALAMSGCNFLDLPVSVRKLVYDYVGLEDALVCFNYSNLKIYPKGSYPDTKDFFKVYPGGWYPLKKLDVAELDEVWELDPKSDDDSDYGSSSLISPYMSYQSLLLTSKEIHKEVEPIIYARNVFRVCLGQPMGFTRLLRLSDTALSDLGALTIRLDTPKTKVSDDGWENEGPEILSDIGWDSETEEWLEDEKPKLTPTPTSHLQLSREPEDETLHNWKLVLERLTRLTKPVQLRLRVIFRAKTTRDAKAIIEPMTPLLPKLKDLGICAERYGRDFRWFDPSRHEAGWERPERNLKVVDTAISELVQEALRQVVPKDTRTGQDTTAAVRYLDLPREVRFAILEYTDLVPSHPVQWRPQERKDKECCDSRDGTSKCSECGRQSGPSIESYHFWPCCGNCSPHDTSGICYCSGYGATWSTSCTCALKRHALFQVSSEVRQDAIAVYYSRSQILVTPYNAPHFRVMHPEADWSMEARNGLPKIELSLYLSSIERNALRHIRWLEWILPMKKDVSGYLVQGTKAWTHYLDTISLMERAMTLTALTFTINMGICNHHQTKKSALWQDSIVLPVKRLGEAGLKAFFVNLPGNMKKEKRERRERDLEKVVMGREYDSAIRGKPVERMAVEMAKARERNPEIFW